MPRDPARVRQIIGISFCLTSACRDGEGRDFVEGACPAHHRDYGARVEAARQKRAHRNVRDQLTFDRGLHERRELDGNRALGCRAQLAVVWRRCERPPSAHPSVRHDERGARLELLHRAQHRARRRGPQIRQRVVKRLGVDLAGQPRMLQQRLELGAEEKPLGRFREVERLYTHWIARQYEAAAGNPCGPATLAVVMNRECEDAVETVQHVQAVALVQMQQDLAVGPRHEPVAPIDELGSQLAEVVDLAVERQRQSAQHPARRVRSCRHRLRSGTRQIENRQAPMAESGRRPISAREQDHAFAVGTAVRNRVRHRA